MPLGYKYNTMKVYQIVSEAGILSALRTGYNAFRGARTAAPAVANTVRRTAAGRTAAARTAARAADDAPPVSYWEREAARLANRTAGREAALAAGSLRATVLASNADDVVRFMYAAGIAKEAIVYWAKSEEIENNNNLSPEEKQQAIRKLRGEFILTVIAPKIGAWTISKVAFPLKIIPWLTRISGSPNAAAVMKHLSKRGTEAALIAWFAAGGGKDWLNDTMGFLVTGVGSAPELIGKVYDVTKAATQVATGNLPPGYKPSGDAVDLNDPASVMNKVGDMMGGGSSGNYVDPFKGTGRGGK